MAHKSGSVRAEGEQSPLATRPGLIVFLCSILGYLAYARSVGRVAVGDCSPTALTEPDLWATHPALQSAMLRRPVNTDRSVPIRVLRAFPSIILAAIPVFRKTNYSDMRNASLSSSFSPSIPSDYRQFGPQFCLLSLVLEGVGKGIVPSSSV